MFILHVTYTVKEGLREPFLSKLAELGVAEKSRLEAGNIDYSYYLPVGEDNRIFLKEVWESRAAQEAHTGSEHFLQLKAVKDDYVEDTKLELYDTV